METSSTRPLQLKDPLVGSRLGEYEVLEPIGEGGMGVVYRGVHPLIKKRVAIKVLKPGAATDEGHVKRLIAEAEAVNAIGHRSIIDIFGLGQLDDGRPYIVMEYLEGEPLDAYLRANPRLPLHETLALLIEIAAPLAAAHARGVIHRDLKPSNVFRCRQPDGIPYLKLLDFGLAKRAMEGGSSAQTSQHLVAGTPDYMAPEQARALPVSARTDIYAFGVMAYEMLTGEVPYDGQTPMDVMMAHVSRPVPSPSAKVPGLPPALDDLVRRMMAKSPDDRPASMGDVRAELKAIAARLSPAGPYQRLEPPPDRPSSSNETPAVRVGARPPATLLAPQSGHTSIRPGPPRALWVAGAALVLVLAAGALWTRYASGAATAPSVDEHGDAAPAGHSDGARPSVVEAVPLTPVELPAAPDEASVPLQGQRPSPAPAAKTARRPTPEQLRARVNALRKELERLMPPGESPSPADLRMLDRYKLESYSSDVDLAALERKLNAYERNVLGPLRRR